MNNEKLTKRLAIFYHPLFQGIIKRWTKSFQLSSENMNMITFIEVNIRIQKAMINDFDFYNSLSSALTDWMRELDNLSEKTSSKNSTQKKWPNTKKEKDPIQSIQDQLNSLTFEGTATNEKYLTFFKLHKNHQALKYASTLLSFDGFGKFLFDLCSSWCEDLDIELFAFFLIGLFVSITNCHQGLEPTLKRTDQIENLPNTFHTQMKLLKSHYNRYKKIDLTTYQSWYEWNYMPFRMIELKAKVNCELYPNSLKAIQTNQICFSAITSSKTHRRASGR